MRKTFRASCADFSATANLSTKSCVSKCFKSTTNWSFRATLSSKTLCFFFEVQSLLELVKISDCGFELQMKLSFHFHYETLLNTASGQLVSLG